MRQIQRTARQPGARLSGGGARRRPGTRPASTRPASTRRRSTTRKTGKNLSRSRGVPAKAGRLLWRRRLLFIGLAGLLLFVLFLPLQIKTWRQQSELNQLQNEKGTLLQQQQQIQQQIDYYNSNAYVEEAARQDLGLVKPGEALVLPAVPGKAKPLPKNYHANIAGPYGD